MIDPLAFIAAVCAAPFLTQGERLELIEEIAAVRADCVQLEDIQTRWEVRFDGGELANLADVESYENPVNDALREMAKAVLAAEKRRA